MAALARLRLTLRRRRPWSRSRPARLTARWSRGARYLPPHTA